MRYCKNCSTLVESTVSKFCPSCGFKMEDDFQAVTDSSEDGFRTVSDVPETSPAEDESGYRPLFVSPPASSPASPASPVSPAPPVSPVNQSPVFASPEPRTLNQNSLFRTEDVGYGVFGRIMLFLLALVLPPAGIIVAIILMNGESLKKKEFAQNVLIVSLLEIALVLLCCCIITVLAMTETTDFLQQINDAASNYQ